MKVVRLSGHLDIQHDKLREVAQGSREAALEMWTCGIADRAAQPQTSYSPIPAQSSRHQHRFGQVSGLSLSREVCCSLWRPVRLSATLDSK